MDILYVSGMCSDKKYHELLKSGVIRKLPQAQKYHRLLIEGLRENTDGVIHALCSFPTNRAWTKKITFRSNEEEHMGIVYKYPFFINLPIARQICLIFFSFLYALKFLYNKKTSVAICDILLESCTIGTKMACKLLRRKCVGIVTDVPGKKSTARKKTLPKYKQYIFSILEKISTFGIHKYDAYLFLTEAMNEIVNQKKKPYIVIEGHADISMSKYTNRIENKYDKKTILYSGGVHREFGIEMLVKAFLDLGRDDCELHIYGDGNYELELKKMSSENKQLKYFGTIENSEVILAQMRAHILINPRLTNADYIKYSFPSKNMEYMASGTPMLTTRLPGMPKEYYDYVYFIDDESMDGFKQSLTYVLSIPEDELHKKGDEAKSFILNNKNNIVQSSKLVEFIKGIYV